MTANLERCFVTGEPYRPPQSNQEAFDRVWRHLTRPGAQRAMSGKDCCYINSSGERCAVGCLLSVEAAERAERMGFSVRRIISDPIIRLELVSVDPGMLEDLQEEHDPSNWLPDNSPLQVALKEVAARYGVEAPSDGV